MFCGGALVAHLNVRSGSGSVKRKRFIVFAMTCGDVPAAAYPSGGLVNHVRTSSSRRAS